MLCYTAIMMDNCNVPLDAQSASYNKTHLVLLSASLMDVDSVFGDNWCSTTL